MSDPRMESQVMRTEQELVKELRMLVRAFSFNIVNLEKGFTVSRGNYRAKFARMQDLPYDQRCYWVSGPRLNGILELKLGEQGFLNVSFIETIPASGPTGRVVDIEHIPFR